MRKRDYVAFILIWTVAIMVMIVFLKSIMYTPCDAITEHDGFRTCLIYMNKGGNFKASQ